MCTRWAYSADCGILVYCIFVASCALCSIRGFHKIARSVTFLSQVLLPLTQVNVLIGLALYNRKSLFYRFCCLQWMQFLGKISMSFYLVHEPLIQYVNCIVYGPLSWPDDVLTSGLDESDEDFEEKRTSSRPGTGMPAWGIPTVVVTALIIAVVLERFVEAPMRFKLRSSRVAVAMPAK